MALPFLALIPFATKLLAKVLPDKPKQAITELIDTVVKDDKELQELLESERKFILEYEGRAEFLSKAVGVLRAIPRLYISVGIATVLFKYLWLNLAVPDKLWYLAGIVFSFHYYFRHREKMNTKSPQI